MSKQEKKESAAKGIEGKGGWLVMDGFDDCIMGVCERCNQESIVAYDIIKVIKKIMRVESCSHEEAVESHVYNQLSAWHGDRTPCFIYPTEPMADIDLGLVEN